MLAVLAHARVVMKYRESADIAKETDTNRRQDQERGEVSEASSEGERTSTQTMTREPLYIDR